MPPELLKRLDKEVLVSSGAIPTMLPRWGFNLGDCVAAWCVVHLDVVQEIVRQFFKAGCDIGIVNNAACNRLRLKRFGLQDKAYEFVLKIGKATREVTPPDRYLEGSLGTTGYYMAPAGEVTFDEVYEAYAEQVKALTEVGVDVISVTMTEYEQGRAAFKAVKDVNPKLPIIGRAGFDRGKKGFHNQAGINPTRAAEKLEEFGADVIGLICGGTTLQDATVILQEMRQHCTKPLAARPNAGIPEMVDAAPVHPVTPEAMAQEVPHWIAAGARIVGGCCGTNPEHIAKVAAVIKGRPWPARA